MQGFVLDELATVFRSLQAAEWDAILVVREWLREQLPEPRVVFRAVARLASCTASPDGVHAFAQGVDLADAVPTDDMRADAKFSVFFEQRWPQLMEKITRKRQRHLDALRKQSP